MDSDFGAFSAMIEFVGPLSSSSYPWSRKSLRASRYRKTALRNSPSGGRAGSDKGDEVSQDCKAQWALSLGAPLAMSQYKTNAPNAQQISALPVAMTTSSVPRGE